MCCLQTKLTIQQKFRFLEISKLQVPNTPAVQPAHVWHIDYRFKGSARRLGSQRNGTRPNPRYRVFGYCTCKQHTKERYWV